MKTEMTTLVAAIVAGALIGCASGGGSGGSSNPPLNIDTREEAAFCMVLPGLCLLFGDLGTPQGDTSYDSGSAQASGWQMASFTAWSDLRRDATTVMRNNLIGESQYYVPEDGAIRVQSLEISGRGYVEVQYDAAGRPAHFAASNFPGQGGRTLSNLAAAGQSWADVTYVARGVRSPQTPFTSQAAGEIELAANPYRLGWNYQSFGVWDSEHAGYSSRRFGGTSYGAATPASAVPTSGSATFTGKLGGMYVAPAGQGSVATADIRVDANFSSRSLGFASSATSLTRDLASAVSAPNLNLSGTLTYSPASNSFAGTLTNAGGTMSGFSTGRYYGPAAQELGGVFTMKSSTTPEAFSGAYGAKR